MMERTNPIPLTKPMLAIKSEAFDSQDYLYEVKWDGYRVMAYLDSTGTELRSRNQLDITASFPELSSLHLFVKGLPVLLDGEVVAFSGDNPSFSALQSRGRLSDSLKIRQASVNTPVLYVAFDILYLSNKSLLSEPLWRRKEILSDSVLGNKSLIVADFIIGQGILFAELARERGLEGVVAKNINGPYLPGKRTPYWKKIRHTNEADLVICGYIKGNGGRKLGSLMLCGYDSKRLVYSGKVGTGFNRETEEDLMRKLEPLQTEKPPVEVPRKETRDAVWVKPELICMVEYLEKTADGILRHPSFKGLRFDKKVEDCKTP